MKEVSVTLFIFINHDLIKYILMKDMRICSLEENLQRLTQEVEAYRRFSSREHEAGSGSKNQIEQLQQILKEEAVRNKYLEEKLDQQKLGGDNELKQLSKVYELKIQSLEDELAAAQNIINQPEFIPEIVQKAGTLHIIQMQKRAEDDLRLSNITIKQLEKSLERANRRAERAENENEDALKLLNSLEREQHIKDSQIEGLKGHLQEIFNRPTEEKNDEKNNEGKEEFEDVLEMELESMRLSYEGKLSFLQETINSAHREIKQLKEEISSLR